MVCLLTGTVFVRIWLDPTNSNGFFVILALIDKSGMVYSQEWVNGNIRGNLIGKIPNDLLLLCFVSKRFVKAGELLLSGLTRDLEVYNIVKEAMKEWGLEDKFERVSETMIYALTLGCLVAKHHLTPIF